MEDNENKLDSHEPVSLNATPIELPGGELMVRGTEHSPKSEKRISDEELGTLLSGVGNHEGKAALLLMMKKGNIYGVRNLHNLFTYGLQGEKPVWETSIPLQRQWCVDSLGPIGLVAEELMDAKHNFYGYGVTDKGEELGVPLVGLLLDFSRQNPDIALVDVFGDAQIAKSKGSEEEFQKRNSYNRLQIMNAIVRLTEENNSRSFLTAQQIVEATGLPNDMVGKILRNLSDVHMINYESVGSDSKVVYFKMPTEVKSNPLPFKDQVTMSDYLLEFVKKYPGQEMSVDDIYPIMKKDFPDVSEGYVRNRISNILSHFVRQGVVTRVQFELSHQSEIKLTAEQAERLSKLTNMLTAFQNQDPSILLEGNEKAEYFRTHKEELTALVGKAKEHSREVNAVPVVETYSRIESIVSQNAGSTSKSITEALAKPPYNQIISLKQVATYLRQLEGKGIFRRSDTKTQIYWEVIPPTERPSIKLQEDL